MSIAGKGKHSFHHTAEAKAKISAAGTGQKFSAETRAKISKAGKGRKHTEEAKVKMSLNRRDKKKVRCIETGEIFESVSSVVKFFNTEPTQISRVCRGVRKTYHGYHFEFVQD